VPKYAAVTTLVPHPFDVAQARLFCGLFAKGWYRDLNCQRRYAVNLCG
jgi:hypothetical protein